MTGGIVTGGIVTGGVVTGGIVTGGVVTGGIVTGGVVTGGVVTGGVVTGVVSGVVTGVVSGVVGEVAVAVGVKGSCATVGRADVDLAFTFAGLTVGTVVGLILTLGTVTVGSVVGVAEPGTTCRPFGTVVDDADAAVSWVDALPTKSMALTLAMITAPATMIDHRQNVSSSPGSAATFFSSSL